MLTEFMQKLAHMKAIHGADALKRVEQMIEDRPENRQDGQQQSKWILPGLSTTPWLSPRQFDRYVPLVDCLEHHAATMRSEMLGVINRRSSGLVNYEHYLGKQDDWQAVYLFKDGKVTHSLRDEMPVTWQVFDSAIRAELCPLLECHFSILDPGTEIKPHCDLWNFSLNMHLAIDIPAQCGIEVAGEQRQWQAGQCMLFDYSFLHRAWNHGQQQRICLLMDLWHPDVTAIEREALSYFVDSLRKLVD